jgi:hypothetical protein
MTLDRREFLKLCGLAGGSASMSVWLSGCSNTPAPAVTGAKKLGHLLGAGQFVKDNQTLFTLSVLNLDDPQAQASLTELSFFAHGIVIDPSQPTRAALFQKKGPGACEVDLAQGKVTRTIKPEDGRDFYGHGAYSPDGKWLFSTEADPAKEGTGLIALRDAKTLSILEYFPSFGPSPHDCKMIDSGKTLVVANSGSKGEKPCVTYVDTASRKLIEKIPLTQEGLSATHLALTDAGDIAVVSAPLNVDGVENKGTDGRGGIHLRQAGKKGEPLTPPQDLAEQRSKMVGETLSVCIHEPSGVVAATNPKGDLVTFWNLKIGKFVSSLSITKPRGIALTLDQSMFVITCDQPGLILISTASLEPIQNKGFGKVLVSGSHAWVL